MFGRGRRVFLNRYFNFLAKAVGEYVWFLSENITTELRKLFGWIEERRLQFQDKASIIIPRAKSTRDSDN